MMKCALVLLAAGLLFCSLYTCAAGAADIQKGTLPKMKMRSNTLQEALPADTATDSVTVDVTVTGTAAAAAGAGAGANAGTVTVKVVVAGTGAGEGAGTFTGTGSITAGTNPVTVTFTSASGSGSGKTVTGELTISGISSLTAADIYKGTGTHTSALTDGTAAKVTIAAKADQTASGTVTGDVTGSVTVTKGSSNTVTIGGTVTIAKKTAVDPAARSSSASSTTTTTTEAPETTTTSTAAPTEAPPQQSTEKPINPTEGKTDSSNSHVALHVALFIGTIALISVV